MDRRWVMHVDMDAFYASVEQLEREEYRGKPVIVGGLSERGVVATASYEARRYGVHSAMPMKRAKRLCPDGIYLRPRIAHYREISRTIRAIMERYSPYIEPLSLDEAFLDISGMGSHYTHIEELGRAIKREIKMETGLTASAGIAPNKFLAKLASDLKKPDGLVYIPYGKEREILAPLPLRRLWGVGRVTEERLLAAGFRTIGDIALADLRVLEPLCGRQLAIQLKQLAVGQDDRPIEWKRDVQSIGNEETFPQDLTDPEEIDRKWRLFAHLVAARLRQKRKMGRTISIKVRFNTFRTLTRSLTLEDATDREEDLYKVAVGLYNSIAGSPVRLIGLTAGSLQTVRHQMDLFDETREKREKISDLLDTLQHRFGEKQVMQGIVWELEKRENHHDT